MSGSISTSGGLIGGAAALVPYAGGLLTGHDYIPTYFPASWKGVSFVCEKTDDTFGRYQDIYEYPLSNATALKDLGRRARRFKLSGYLIGNNQVDITRQMIQQAESPDPGPLSHPMLGIIQVSCVTLKVSAEYRKDIRRTKLEFDFVEAETSMAPYALGLDINSLFGINASLIYAVVRQAMNYWDVLNAEDQQQQINIERSLAQAISPATDEASFDAIDRLQREPDANRHLVDVVEPIIEGTATVRRIHADAQARLETWSRSITTSATEIAAPGSGATRSADAIVLIARVSLARDLALVAAQTTYRTVREALADLDRIVRLYDEEERIAVFHCEDELTIEIRAARAAAISLILNQNIRLPGVVERDTVGVWPSLVIAQKLYGDGRRHTDIENYNPQQNPFFVGRTVAVPAS